MKAHPSALVDPGAAVADDVEIGPFCIVGPGTRLGPGCRLGPRVALLGSVVAGRDNHFHAHVTVGTRGGGPVEIGDGNVFRESTHIDAPKPEGSTRIGSRNHFGTWVGLGAGCTVGDDVLIGSLSTIGEDCALEDGTRIEGQCVIEEKRRIGKRSRIRSQVPVASDVPPLIFLDGNPAEVISPEASDG
jgi:UDP-N-acetylglucosamine acyltransferase